MVDTTESVGDGAFMLLSAGSEGIYQSLEVPKRHHSVILDTCALNDFDNLRQTQRLPCHVIVLRSVSESRVEASILSESLGYRQSQLPPYHKENQVSQRKPIPLLIDRVKVQESDVLRQRTVSYLVVFTHLGICKDLCHAHPKCQVHKRAQKASFIDFPVLGKQHRLSVG